MGTGPRLASGEWLGDGFHLVGPPEGLCYWCHRNPPRPTSTICDECATDSRLAAWVRTEARKAAGLCPRCGEAPEPGRVHCRTCVEYQVQWARDKRAMWRLAGLCTGCGGVRDRTDRRHCADCRRIHRRKRSRNAPKSVVSV